MGKILPKTKMNNITEVILEKYEKYTNIRGREFVEWFVKYRNSSGFSKTFLAEVDKNMYDDVFDIDNGHNTTVSKLYKIVRFRFENSVLDNDTTNMSYLYSIYEEFILKKACMAQFTNDLMILYVCDLVEIGISKKMSDNGPLEEVKIKIRD